MSLKARLEAVIYAAEEPVTLAQLAGLFATEALDQKQAREAASAEAAAATEAAPQPALAAELAEAPADSVVAASEAEPQPVEAAQPAELAPERDAEAQPETEAEAAPPEPQTDAAPETESEAEPQMAAEETEPEAAEAEPETAEAAHSVAAPVASLTAPAAAAEEEEAPGNAAPGEGEEASEAAEAEDSAAANQPDGRDESSETVETAEAAEAEPASSETDDEAEPAELTLDAPEALTPEALAAEERRAARQREREIRDELRRTLDELIADYSTSSRGMEIRVVAGGYRVGTKPEYHDSVRAFVKSLKPPIKLSLQALETLAVIAYKQPITAPEVSEIRGVDSAGVIGSLISRKLVTTAGRKQVIGRPILYKTTKEFLLRFGLRDLNELPSMEEFEKMAGELSDAEPADLPFPQNEIVAVEEASANEAGDMEEDAEDLAAQENAIQENATQENVTAAERNDAEPASNQGEGEAIAIADETEAHDDVPGVSLDPHAVAEEQE